MIFGSVLTSWEVYRFFFALLLLLFSALGLGFIFQHFRLPRVIGEIMGGLILGPTILGYFSPQIHNEIFNAFENEGQFLSIVYWIGLVLLMFISGFEIQKSLNKDDRKTIIAILVGATAISFIAGWIAPYFYDFAPFLGEKSNMLALQIVIAIAIAVTSIPVISKIFLDLKIIDTRFAKIVLATATIEDIILWVALSTATGIALNEAPSLTYLFVTISVTLLFFAVTLFLLPRLIKIKNTKKQKNDYLNKFSAPGFLIIICFFFATITSALNINIVFGAFIAGILVGMIRSESFNTAKKSIKELSLGFFVPIYFAIVGLKLDLIHSFDVLFFIGFFAFAVLVKTIGTIVAAKLIKKDWLTSLNLGIAMNTRGGPGIILATVAFEIGIINEKFFVVLVMTAILTSLLAGCWLRYVISKGWKLLTD